METYGEMNQKNAIAAAETLLEKPKKSTGRGGPRGSHSQRQPKRRVPASEQATQPKKSPQKDPPAVGTFPNNQPAPVPLEHVPYLHEHVNICSALAAIISTSEDDAQVISRCAGKERTSKMKLFKRKVGFLDFLGSMDPAERSRVKNCTVAVIMEAVLTVWKRTDPCANHSSPPLSTPPVRTGHATGSAAAAFAAPTAAAATAAATAAQAAAAAAVTAARNDDLQHRQQNTQLPGASFTDVPQQAYANDPGGLFAGPRAPFIPSTYIPRMSQSPFFPGLPQQPPFATRQRWVPHGQSGPAPSTPQAQWTAAEATEDAFA
jgi:hypothetical protein